MGKSCLIVGAGHAAASLGPALRQAGWDGSITIVGEEPHLPYHRPPLSKEFLAGKRKFGEIPIQPGDVYKQAEIRFIGNTRVEAIARGKKRVRLSTGEILPYDRLALAVGAVVRRIDVPGATLEGVYHLRTAADSEAIRARVKPGSSAVIVGGGYIGLEVAAVLRAAAMEVTVLEARDRCMRRVTAPAVSAFYERVHREHGVRILCNTTVTAFEGSGSVERVVCRNGTKIPADLVVIGIGIVPNLELAREAGLAVGDGIVVDEFTRTSDPDIFAAGDCTNHPSRLYGRRVRLESVQNATEQGRAAALAICGRNEAYDAVPRFWSDQYDLTLQITGLSQGFDRVALRGDSTNGRSFAVFYMKSGSLIAVDAINRPQEFMVSRKLVSARARIDTARLADLSVPVRELATR